MNTEDEHLDKMLGAFKVEEPSSNLAERIISASHEHSVEQEQPSILSMITSSFLLFKPAPALACALMIGLLSGWYISNNDLEQSDFAVEDELMAFIDYEISAL